MTRMMDWGPHPPPWLARLLAKAFGVALAKARTAGRCVSDDQLSLSRENFGAKIARAEKRYPKIVSAASSNCSTRTIYSIDLICRFRF
jgi:hypothetical protein